MLPFRSLAVESSDQGCLCREFRGQSQERRLVIGRAESTRRQTSSLLTAPPQEAFVSRRVVVPLCEQVREQYGEFEGDKHLFDGSTFEQFNAC